MTIWEHQGSALVGRVQLRSNRRGKAVLLPPGPAQSGVTIIVPSADGKGVTTVPFEDCLNELTPESIITVICAKERVFGGGRLPSLETA